MARLARIVIPGVPHHVIQRGNRRQQVFFGADDYSDYIELMAEWCQKSGVEIWAYCLMPNHIHLIAVPVREESFKKGIPEAHRRYARMINFRNNWRGHLWQGRFASYPMDDKYLYYAARYIELNPVRAGIVKRPEDYKWSSAAAHMAGKDDNLVKVRPLLDRIACWSAFLDEASDDAAIVLLKKCERTGRPLGSQEFIEKLEKISYRKLLPGKPGPKRKPQDQAIK